MSLNKITCCRCNFDITNVYIKDLCANTVNMVDCMKWLNQRTLWWGKTKLLRWVSPATKYQHIQKLMSQCRRNVQVLVHYRNVWVPYDNSFYKWEALDGVAGGRCCNQSLKHGLRRDRKTSAPTVQIPPWNTIGLHSPSLFPFLLSLYHLPGRSYWGMGVS